MVYIWVERVLVSRVERSGGWRCESCSGRPGGVGVAAIKGVLEHPDLELVGLLGALGSQERQGRRRTRRRATPLGVTATNDVDEILALDADAVIYSPLMPNPDEVTALLRSGKNVVTPVGWFYPGEKEARPDARGRARR